MPSLLPLLHAADVHASAIVVDTHADTTQYLLDEGVDFTAPKRADLHLDLAKARAGGLGAEFFSIWVDPEGAPQDASKRALDLIDAVLEQVRAHPDALQLALTADDVVAAHKAKKFAVLMGVEGGHAIENDLAVLRTFFRLGVRYMTLTHSVTIDWADSSGDASDPKVKHHGGLTPFGEDVVREMNRLGMIVDISHVADATLDHVLRITKVPVLASHSSSRALCDVPRNLTDAQLKAIAANGGVVQVNFFSGFLDAAWLAQWKKSAPERTALKKGAKGVAAFDIDKQYATKLPRPKFEVLIDHIDHIAKVAGVEHVGLGSDFDGIPSLPEGIDSAADLPKITAALLKRGYTAKQLELILGGNTLRLMRDVERAAQPGPVESRTQSR